MLNIGRYERNQPLSGQTLVLFALMSLLLLAGLGLIFDAGLDYSNRRTMQNAADTAALRGARVIAQKAVYADAPDYLNGFVKTEVENTAVANGVPSAANVVCEFLTDALVTSTCNDGPIPSGVTGVKVRVSETHTPLVMRALGVTTTGTAATAAAQVQMVDSVFGRDFPFMVCGIETATVGGGHQSILSDEMVSDPGVGPSPSPLDFWRGDSPWAIQESAYSYDWNVRSDANGTFHDYGGPQFVIYGNGIETCGLGNWKGLVERSTNDNDKITLVIKPILASHEFFLLSKIDGSAGNTDDVSPNRSINGPQGCKADTIPNGCVMVLPIGDGDEWCPSLEVYGCIWDNPTDQQNDMSSLYIRRWGAFFVVYDSASGSYWGRLIKNYPIHTDGVVNWNPTNYVGPLNITIIQAP